jgi:autophagy-related protein 5
VGVLFDLLAGGELPWSIVVHFQNFPAEQVMKLGSTAATPIRSFFMNSLKESTYVKQNGIKVINDFGIRESDAIWEGLYDANFEKFWSIANMISQSSPVLPVRVLRPNFPIMQFPCAFKDASSGEAVTLSAALAHYSIQIGSPSSIFVQGISPPLDTPLSWLSQNFAHPDGFLYIVIKD